MPKDYLSNYLHYAVEGNEVPEIYHKWAGLVSLSMCAGRRFWLYMTDEYLLHPNIYVLLVGSAGGRKSSAMSVAKKIIREIDNIPICATQITKEALAREMTDEDFPGRFSFKDPDTKRMNEYTEYAVFANEWVHFIAVNPTGMIDFLTEIWDQQVYDAKTKNMGNDLIIGPCIPILGCMTPSTMNSQMKSDIINGGFARRCVFVYSGRSDKAVPFPYKTTEQLNARQECIKRGRFIARDTSFCGRVDLTPDAKEWFEDWYVRHRKSLATEVNPLTEGYWQSRHDLLLKVALLHQISGSNERKLTLSAIEQAHKDLEETEKHLPKIFEGAGRNEQSHVASQIIELVGTRFRVKKKELMRAMFGQANVQELTQIIEHLKATDQLVEVSTPKGPAEYMTKENYDELKSKT